MADIIEPNHDDQYKRIQDRIYNFLKMCPHHHELQQSPRMAKLKATFMNYNTNRLIDLEPEHYDAFEADLQRLELEETPPPAFDNSHMDTLHG